MLIRLPILSGVTVAALVYLGPGPGAFGTGEEIALVGAWGLALAAALWLFAVSSCCGLALRRGRVRTARRCAALMPRTLRRGVELAIVTSAIVASAVPAHGITDEPIVRTPRPASTPASTPRPTSTTPAATAAPTPPSTRPRPVSTTASPTTTPPATTAPTTPTSTPLADVPRPEVDAPSPAPPARPSIGTPYVVQPGDNLWLIAQRTLEQRARPARELVAYWHAVIEANASTLRSGDPNLIYPGEVITLPAFGDNR
jgi:LysM repeat protein